MNAYKNIVAEFVSPKLSEVINSKIGIPLATFETPFDWYGFPPALIPICSDGSGPAYLGIWKHWFTERPFSFVKTYVGSDVGTLEIARTEEQFIAYSAIHSITSADGVSPLLVEFAERLEFNALEELDVGTIETGDYAPSFSKFSMFKSKLPLESTTFNDYDGTFPMPNSESVFSASSFEFKEELFSDSNKVPVWLDPIANKLTMFEEFISKGCFFEAWLTLNSTGWTFKDASDCAKCLIRFSDNSLFVDLVTTWVELAQFETGGY